MFRARLRDLPDSCGNTTALIRNVYDGRATDSEAGKPVRRLSEHDARRGDFIPYPVIASSLRHLERKMDMILSLTSGTFVLLVRLFFRFSGKGAACRAPKGERQIENQLHICKW